MCIGGGEITSCGGVTAGGADAAVAAVRDEGATAPVEQKPPKQAEPEPGIVGRAKAWLRGKFNPEPAGNSLFRPGAHREFGGHRGGEYVIVQQPLSEFYRVEQRLTAAWIHEEQLPNAATEMVISDKGWAPASQSERIKVFLEQHPELAKSLKAAREAAENAAPAAKAKRK